MNNSAPRSLFPYGCRRGFAIAIATLLLLLTKSETLANDLLTITVYQNGANVVATGSGDVDLTDLTPVDAGYTSGLITPENGEIILGPSDNAGVTEYEGLSGPASFGTGSTSSASMGTGDTLGTFEESQGSLFLPTGYTSGNSLSDSATWDSATFASLGITPGIYTYSYGTGSDAGEIIVDAPEPSTWALMLGGAALLGFCASRKLA